MRANVASILAMATTATAHTLMYGVWVNDVDQGDGQGKYIRSPPNNSPVKDLESPDIVCNVNGGTAVSDFVTAKAGDKLSFEWYHNVRNDDILDPSHQGPVITYIAQFTEGNGAEPIWSKIAEEGMDGVNALIANGGKADFTLPTALASGKYLVRQEIIAHHESDVSFKSNPSRGAQLYPSCVQLEVSGDGDQVPDQAFDFNTGYTYEDPGLVGVNVYNGPVVNYQIPGPEVWTASGSSPAPPPAPSPSSPAPSPSSPATTGAPAPTSTTVPDLPIPSTTLTTVISPAPTGAPQPPTPQPPAECSRKKRSLKRSRKAKRSGRAAGRF
ncbi:glycosyl hydrolase family 61-domain-containing protein [Stachybotrys elegans]|uniref:lytic cellulose monooxygenase (C4-dehydrogenating) n=1 Tax=Stachybotrys elegans TaxID=80388 RepID=A0A8K0SIG6_9HYPO|nr:glycosyl hydrolase family 61-domain-containing protein [Stachybotrys elegans]